MQRPALPGKHGSAGITDAGRGQAQALADYLASKDVCAMYTSSQPRAVQTARIINDRLDVPMTFCASLNEADTGAWEGLTQEHISRTDPIRFAEYQQDPGCYGFPGGETLSQVCSRMLKFIRLLAVRHPDQRVVAVSHDLANRAALASLMGVPLQRIRDVDQHPGCLNVIRVFRGEMTLQAVDYTSSFGLTEEDDELCDALSSAHADSA